MFFVNVQLNTKAILACTAVVIAISLIVAPSVIGGDAFAGKSKKSSNWLSQKIKQSESNSESSKVVSSGDIKGAGNNFNVQKQVNKNGNTASQ
jgi:hypothetical protein